MTNVKTPREAGQAIVRIAQSVNVGHVEKSFELVSIVLDGYAQGVSRSAMVKELKQVGVRYDLVGWDG